MNSPLNFARGSLCLGGMLLLFFPQFQAGAEVIAEYAAPADPVSPEAKWVAAGRSNAGTQAETLEPAWRIAPQEGNALSYSMATPEDFLPDAFAKGWKYSARLRLDPVAGTPVGRYVATLGVENAVKKEAFVLWVRTDEADGALMVEFNRRVIPLPGLAANAFHDYAIIYDQATSTARLLVDGETYADDVPATPTERWFLRWGHQSVTARGVAEWAAVKFESPVPAKQ